MIFYGINPVSEALRAKLPVSRLFVQEGKEQNRRIAGILARAKTAGIPIDFVQSLFYVCKTNEHQGLAAQLDQLPLRELRGEAPNAPQFVMLDGIMDPHNFGAILRVCDFFGFPDVIYHKGDSSGITPASIKASAGAVFHLQLYTSNLNQAVRLLRDQQYALVVLDANAPTTLYDFNPPDRYCLIIGSEGDGVRDLIHRQADHIVGIPRHGLVDSLNVSCALSATLSELSRRRPATALPAPKTPILSPAPAFDPATPEALAQDAADLEQAEETD